MPRKSSGRPTDAELAILTVLWERGASTVREVHDRLDGDVGYTTALKLMQIMTEKGLVERDETQRAHIYSAACSPEQTRGGLIDDLVSRAFDGSASPLPGGPGPATRSGRRSTPGPPGGVPVSGTPAQCLPRSWRETC